MKPDNYIVTAYKWGNREEHSYNVGVFTKKTKAFKCADDHTAYRGGKYACVVEKCVPDSFYNDMEHYTEEIYRTKSMMCK